MASKPQPGLEIPELFSGPLYGTFGWTFFDTEPGHVAGYVGAAEPTCGFARNAKCGFGVT